MAHGRVLGEDPVGAEQPPGLADKIAPRVHFGPGGQTDLLRRHLPLVLSAGPAPGTTAAPASSKSACLQSSLAGSACQQRPRRTWDPRPRPSAAGPVSGISIRLRDDSVARLVGKVEDPEAEPTAAPPLSAALDAFPHRDCWMGATRRVGGRGAQTHLPPNPYQALGLGGRSRPRPRGQCATGDRAARPQDVVLLADRRGPSCASPDGRSAHRHPMSFSRSSTALSRALLAG